MIRDQEEHFSKDALVKLFEERVVKSRAVGLDGTRLDMFAAKLNAEAELISRKTLQGCYKFTAYREKLILKGSSRLPRQISVPTVRDRLTLRAICNSLTDQFPNARSLPPHYYIKAIADLIRSPNDPVSFIRVDVMDFFPSIDHYRLIKLLERSGCKPFLLKLIQGSIENRTGKSRNNNVNPIGVPQGLSISNLLSAVFLGSIDADEKKKGGYFRYVDDILIVEKSHLATQRYKALHTALADIGLKPHPMGTSGKTDITRVSDGIDYLGYHLTPSKVSVRDSSYHRMFSNLSKVFTQYKYRQNAEHFIFKLNLRITGCVVDGKRKGWLMFFSQTENLSQLKYLDGFVQRAISKLGIAGRREEVARFVKTYHEIRFKGLKSNYIPNFDSFSLDEKYRLISTVTGKAVEELGSRSVTDTDREFKELVSREVADLEQDVLNHES